MSDPVDVLKLRKGAEVVLLDGRKGVVRGCYMSSQGVVVTVKTNLTSIVDENIPLDQIKEVVANG